MNKSYTYGIIALALVAILLAGAPLLMQPSSEVDTAAVVQSVASGTVGQSQTISWDASSFPVVTVVINLIRKTSDSPVSYEFVRTIDSSAPNTGSATWIPAEGEIGADLFIEVACAASAEACNSVVASATI